MNALLLALAICWNADADVDYWRVRFAERYIVEWVACPPPTIGFCPVYSPFAWAWHSVDLPRFDSPPCAEAPGDVCFYIHPTAIDAAGNESGATELLWPPPYPGGCP